MKMVDNPAPNTDPKSTSTTPAPQSWLPSGLDAETTGWIQNRGYDKKTPVEAALDAIKGHREAEKFNGAPASQLLRLPKDAGDEAGWNAVYTKLGAPSEAKAYDEPLNGVKFADGTSLEQADKDAIKAFAFKNHLSPGAAADIAKSLVGMVDANESGTNANAEQVAAIEAKKLNDSWGGNREVNTVIAKNAAARLGPEFLAAAQALEGQAGFADTMRLFHMIGQLMGEDKFLRDANGGHQGGFTKEQALARKAELMADPDWVKRYNAGGAAEKREFANIIALTLGG
jgi:hypothetical protein